MPSFNFNNKFHLDSKATHLMMLLVGLLSYGAAVFTGYIGDDPLRISNVYQFYDEGLLSAIDHILPDRPILIFSVWLNYIITGKSIFAFKLVNLILHLIAGILVYKLLTAFDTSEQSPNDPYKKMIPILAVAAWLAHPMNNVAVMSIIQRGIIIAFILYIISTLYWIQYIKEKQSKYYLLSLLFLILSVATKPNTVFSPLSHFFLLYYFNKKINWKQALSIIPFIFASAYPIIPYRFNSINQQFNALGTKDYLLMQAEVVFTYFRKYIIPYDLSFYNKEAFVMPPIFSVQRLTYLMIHIALFSSSLIYFFMKKNKIGLLAVLTYLALLPESSLFPIAHHYFDHRNYIPLVFALYLFFHFTSYLKKHFTLVSVLFIGSLVLFNWKYIYNTRTYDKFVVSNMNEMPELYPFYQHEAFSANNYDLAYSILTVVEKKLPETNDFTEGHQAELKRFYRLIEVAKMNEPGRADQLSEIVREFTKIDFSINYMLSTLRVIKSGLENPNTQSRYLIIHRDFVLGLTSLLISKKDEVEFSKQLVEPLVLYLKEMGLSSDHFSNLETICQQQDCLPILKTIFLLNIGYKIPFNAVKLEETLNKNEKLTEAGKEAGQWIAKTLKIAQ